jgi:hypothetical protein
MHVPPAWQRSRQGFRQCAAMRLLKASISASRTLSACCRAPLSSQREAVWRIAALIKLIAIYEATVLCSSNVWTALVRKCPAKPPGSGLRNLTAIGHVNPGRCRWKCPRCRDKADDPQHEGNSFWPQPANPLEQLGHTSLNRAHREQGLPRQISQAHVAGGFRATSGASRSATKNNDPRLSLQLNRRSER